MIDQIDLIDIYRTFHLKTADYTFFSSAHGYSPGENILWVTNLASVDLRKTEVISSIFSDHNAMRLEINYMEKT